MTTCKISILETDTLYQKKRDIYFRNDLCIIVPDIRFQSMGKH